jgi:hypothetical protein
MGDLLDRWLIPPEGQPPEIIYGDRFVVYGYPLPDHGRLQRHLASAGRQQFQEGEWFIRRLSEALAAWAAPKWLSDFSKEAKVSSHWPPSRWTKFCPTGKHDKKCGWHPESGRWPRRPKLTVDGH